MLLTGAGIFSIIVQLEQAFVPYKKVISASVGPSCVQFPEEIENWMTAALVVFKGTVLSRRVSFEQKMTDCPCNTTPHFVPTSSPTVDNHNVLSSSDESSKLSRNMKSSVWIEVNLGRSSSSAEPPFSQSCKTVVSLNNNVWLKAAVARKLTQPVPSLGAIQMNLS